ncbi:Zinc finger protein 227 [Araneus ventricosus]|uniref:Zinc finger protein 227 n=1 Tax=Araneus ventricosus TaxID=182803 RepID=A0A4Y2Q257_ARAVE|nr:Zinc finger protein 227 [Araneus ventricosus]
MGYEVTEKRQSSYACDDCHKVFHSRSSFIFHSYEHSNAWPYQCKECGKGLGSKTLLKRHMAKHSDESTHRCDIYQLSFKLKNVLSTHMNIHVTSRNLLDVKKCDKIFHSKSSLKGHMAKHSDHKQRPHECSICQLSLKFK